MTFSVVPETIEEFERQFGRERIATAVADCGIRVSRPDLRLPDDQRRALFQRLIGAPDDAVAASHQAVRASQPSAGTHETSTTRRSAVAITTSDSSVANAATASSTGTASNDTTRLLRQISEEQRARANLEHAFRAQRTVNETLTLQLRERDLELQRASLVEPRLRREMDSLVDQLQSQQRIADENERLRAELKSQATVIEASSRQQRAEANADALRAQNRGLRREADKAKKLYFEGVRQRTQIAELKEKLGALKEQIKASSSRDATAKSASPRRPAATTVHGQLQMDSWFESCIQACARQQGGASKRFVPPSAVAVVGDGPMSENAIETLLQSRGIERVPIGDLRAAVLVVGRDHWEVDQIEEQIKARSGKDLFVHSRKCS